MNSSHVSWLHGSELNKDPLFKGSKGNVYNEQDRMPLFEVEEFPGGLLIGARRNADGGKYYWRITPWIMPWYSIIPPRAGHPLGAHAWVPIDDETCWAWSINYHPKRALTKSEVSAMQDGEGIHVKYVPGTFIPLANKSNNYLLDREVAAHGHSSTGVDGIAMQDASIQESMGPIQDRTKEHLCATDSGIVMTRKILLRAAKAAAEGRRSAGDRAGSAACAFSVDRARQGRLVHRRRQARSLCPVGHRSVVGVKNSSFWRCKQTQLMPGMTRNAIPPRSWPACQSPRSRAASLPRP